MNLDQTFSILFRLRRAKTTSDGFTPIWVRITIDGKRIECSAKRKIRAEHWDVEASRAASSCPDAKAINDHLAALHTELSKRYNVLLTTKDYVSAEDVKHSFKGKKKVEKPKKTLASLYQDFIAFQKALVEKNELSKGRFKRFPVTQGKVESFLSAIHGRTDIPLEELTPPFIVQFHHYLVTTEGVGHNTSMKHAKDWKQVLKFGVTMGHIVTSPFAGFKCSNKKVKRVPLDPDELNTLIQKRFDVERLQEVNDCFVFSSFTGYAFSDAAALGPDNVTIGIDGNKWIIHDRNKTDNPENVPLLPVALAIIEKYKNHPYCVKNKKLLPVKSNQKYNAYLKEIADICGIKKKLTTHVARHTFATTVCLTNGVPIETVQRLLAHGDIRTTQIYAQIVPIKVSADMQELKKKLMAAAPEQDVNASKQNALPSAAGNFGEIKMAAGA